MTGSRIYSATEAVSGYAVLSTIGGRRTFWAVDRLLWCCDPGEATVFDTVADAERVRRRLGAEKVVRVGF